MGKQWTLPKAVLVSFYLIKRTCHLTTKKWGDPDENYLGSQGLFCYWPQLGVVLSLPISPSPDLGSLPGAKAGDRVEPCLW